jgi:internalin A
VILVALVSGCGSSPTAPPILEPDASCQGQPRNAVVSFEDGALEARMRGALGFSGDDDLTCADLAQLDELYASGSGITSLVGIQNAVSLVSLDIGANQIGDFTPLAALGGLRSLLAPMNGIGDISWIQGLTELRFLDLAENSIDVVGPLAGLGQLFYVDLRGNDISDVGAFSGLSLLRFLYLSRNAIDDVTPLGGVASLNTLWLSDNPVSDITALGSLFSVTALHLSTAELTDLGPVSSLTVLSYLDVSDNPGVQSIQPLLDNPGVGLGDTVDPVGTSVPCESIDELAQRAVVVISDCP